MTKLLCYKTNQIINPESFAETIYNNFIYLKDIPNVVHSKSNIIMSLTKNTNIIYLVYDNNTMISYFIGDKRKLIDNRYVYYVSYFYVLAKYRGHKIGSDLLKKIINECQTIGIKFIILTFDTTNIKLLNFYKKYGFVSDPILGTNNNHGVFCLYL